MKAASSQRRGMPAPRKVPRQKKCPYCTELLGPGTVHICPVGCCYVTMGKASYAAVCPYCENTFETEAGHVCLELLRLTDPAQ